MGISLRPITSEDIRNISQGEVSNRASANFESITKGTVVDAELFKLTDEHRKDRKKAYEDEFVRTAHIRLDVPVLNPFLAGRDAKIWQIILSPYKEYIKGIVNGTYAYNLDDGEFYSSDVLGSYVYGENWLIGGQILRHLLKKIDAKESFKTLLYETYIIGYYGTKKSEDCGIIDEWAGRIEQVDFADIERVCNEESGDFVWLIDNWVYIPERTIVSLEDEDGTKFWGILDVEEGSEDYRKLCCKLQDEASDINEVIFRQQFSDIATFYAYINNPSQLENQIMDNIFVLPYGYRPNIDSRIDPLNKFYDRIVALKQELTASMYYQNHSMRTVLGTYTKLVKNITHVFIGEDSLKRYSGVSYKCLTDTLSGKEGLIRDKLQSGRADFTGRTVITCDPFMSIDTVGIPKTMIHKLCEIGAIKLLKKSGEFPVDYIATHDNMKKNKLKDKTEEYIKGNSRTIKNASGKEINVYDYDMYIAVGRQPTLWNLGVQAFRVKPVDGNAIVLSPLVVMPFNADFDGDTMHVESAVGDAAERELSTLMASTNNLFYPKSGELTVELRHEILYGLFMTTSIRDDERSRTWSKDDIMNFPGRPNRSYPEAIYDAVCKNNISIYDKVPKPDNYSFDDNSEYVSAGVAAFKYTIGPSYSKYAIGCLPLVSYGENRRIKKHNDNTNKDEWITIKASDEHLDKNWFMKISELILFESGKQKFIDCINHAVKLGFSIAKVWPPSISAITEINTKGFVAEFNTKVTEREELLNLGIEIESTYSTYFEDELDKLNKKVTKHITSTLGLEEDSDGKLVCSRKSLSNGYVAMWKSGAKGNKSNLMQIFGIKGRVQKDDTNAFNTIIGNSLSTGLTGLESFITAYGGRQGLVDKVLSTAEPGYLSRKLEHAAATWRITCDDCYTSSGVEWTYDDFLAHIDTTQLSGIDELDYQTVKAYVSKLFVGRYIIHNGMSVYIDKPETFFSYTGDGNGEAIDFFNTYVASLEEESSTDLDGNTVTKKVLKKNLYPGEVDYSGYEVDYTTPKMLAVRSPITCKNPCCKKCYGKDLTNNRTLPEIGKPIGFIAAQSIGQPGTQLTMKNFQRGGVASDANLTSSFDKISSYLSLTDLATQKNSKVTLSYDAISPATGTVKTVSLGDGRKKIMVLNSKGKNLLGNRNFYVDERVELKEYVEVGDSFQKVQGDLNIKEILKYRSFEDAYKYLCLIMKRIFDAETEIDMKHFEVIVGSLCSYVLLNRAGNRNPGEVLSLQEYNATLGNGVEGVIAVPTLIGIGELPKYRSDFFESMIMENMKTFVPRAIVMNPYDEMKNPKTRLSFGKRVNIGSGSNDDFINIVGPNVKEG